MPLILVFFLSVFPHVPRYALCPIKSQFAAAVTAASYLPLSDRPRHAPPSFTLPPLFLHAAGLLSSRHSQLAVESPLLPSGTHRSFPVSVTLIQLMTPKLVRVPATVFPGPSFSAQ